MEQLIGFMWFFVRGGANLYNWADNIFIHSHYYFLTCLLLLFIIFWRFKNNSFVVGLIFSLSVLVNIMTALGLLFGLYPYANPLNWALFFILGLIVAQKDSLVQCAVVCGRYLHITLPLAISIIGIAVFKNSYIAYWGQGNIIAGVLFGVVLVGIAYVITDNSKLLFRQMMSYMGKISYTIYLIHMPVAGVLSFLIVNYNLGILVLLAPLIVVIIVTAAIMIILKFSYFIGIEKYVKLLLGTR